MKLLRLAVEWARSGPFPEVRDLLVLILKVQQKTRLEVVTRLMTILAMSSDDEIIARRSTFPQMPSVNETSSSAAIGSDEMIPSPGFTASDYKPLSQLCSPSQPEGPKTSRPVRKRRKMAGSTGKVMKEAYFKGMK